ncbi:MAG: T9SS type A sorting domain-containing protein [Crocinitomicaceae bacterium]
MKTILILFVALLSSTMTNAQDTTWVQTFTFDSISSRRGEFLFPPELNSKRFERVLMSYKLKCSPLTPWDQYNCGEWDYLAYSKIYEHTGLMDSVGHYNDQFLNNWSATQSYNYEAYNAMRMDQYVSLEKLPSTVSTTLQSVLPGTGGSGLFPFDQQAQSDRYQMLLTGAELTAGGITAGDLQSLSLFVPTGGVNGSGEIIKPRISIKATNAATITQFHTTGFMEVYNLSRTSGAGPLIVDGENELVFYQPFTWDGTSNIIIEFYYDRSINTGANWINYESDNTASDMARSFGARNGAMEFSGSNQAMLELSDLDLGDDVTIAFWAQGLGNSGVNTSVLEAYDTLNHRVMNIHMPWSNNRIYWDAGEGSAYDRIDQDMNGAGVDNEWHHWAFIKSTSTGEMKIMRDGVLWHSGTGLNSPVGYMHRMVIGSNRSIANHWTGQIDEFQLYNTAVSEADIATWYNQTVTAAHPNWADLIVYYPFDNVNYAEDATPNNILLMPSEQGMIEFSANPVFDMAADRVRVSIGQGAVGPFSDVNVNYLMLKEPEVVFEYVLQDEHYEISNAFLAIPEGSEDIYDAANTIVSSVPFSGSQTLTNASLAYYDEPFEVLNQIEIGRFITPYGIQFDLGINGFEWIYDVTDYQMYLKDLVDFAAHNTQELIDIKFAFIEGIPPRDVMKREAIWSDYRSYNYANLANDVDLQSVSVALSDSAEMFKIKTRFSGHGQVGNGACCEWSSKDHKLLVDGVERFNWDIWEETACGDNPNVSQGGTWPYAREGWCPGDVVKEYDHDLTPFVTPGTSVLLDYDVTDVPLNDPGQAGGNYVAALDLISYSAPNHQNDAAVIDILNPNSWEYYRKWNPSCQNPRVIIQNTGEQPLTSARVTVWIDYNNKVSFDWTGNLEFLEKEVVEIPIPAYSFWYDLGNSGTFTAHINYLNETWNLDEYQQNDEIVIPFEAPEQMYFNGIPYNGFFVWFKTNNKAYENKWRLMDSDGNTIFERINLANSTDYKDTFDLAPGCYSIILEDSDNDGISFWYSASQQGETAGSFSVKLVGGPVMENFEKDFGNYNQYNFTVGFHLDAEELGEIEDKLMVYPNPNDGVFGIELVGRVDNNAELEIYDIMGRKVFSEKMKTSLTTANSNVDLSAVESGHYIVKVITPNGVFTEEFIKK